MFLCFIVFVFVLFILACNFFHLFYFNFFGFALFCFETNTLKLCKKILRNLFPESKGLGTQNKWLEPSCLDYGSTGETVEKTPLAQHFHSENSIKRVLSLCANKRTVLIRESK